MRLSVWAGLVLLAALAACGPRGAAPMTAFEGRLNDWTQEILTDSPELAAQAGVTPEGVRDAARRLDNRSALALEARRSAAVRRYAELRALDAASLDAADALTLSILRVQFANAAEGAQFGYGAFDPITGVRPYVLNQLDSAFLTLPEFLDRRHTITSLEDADDYLARLEAIAVAIDQETERARADVGAGVRPPRVIIDLTLGLLDDVIAEPPARQIYLTSFRVKLDGFIAAADEAERPRLQQRAAMHLARAEAIVRERIIPAHQRAAQFLRSERNEASEEVAVSHLPRGGEFYAAALAIETTTDFTPDQIHRIGLDRVRVLSGQLDVALRRIGQTEGPVGARLAAITADPRYRYPDSDEGRAQLLADIEARIATMMARAPQYFGALPRAPLEVRRVPAFQEAGQPGASYSSPSLDGATPGVYYVNLRDLSEMTRIDVPTQDFHEAAPGHHFQVALAQEQTDTPLLRRLIAFNAYGEGWGLYAEELADELGFHDGDPVGRIGFLRWQLWRAARLVVDTGLHARGWSRQQAIDYLVETTGDAPGLIATEVDRYIVWPGQACGYELGRREIMALREHARTTLGPDFDLKGFHDVVLLNGETPLGVLGALVREWVPEQRRLADRARRRRN